MIKASKKLVLDLDMTNGTMKSIEINNPVAGKTFDNCDDLANWIIQNNIFKIQGDGVSVRPTELVSAYYKEVVITECV